MLTYVIFDIIILLIGATFGPIGFIVGIVLVIGSIEAAKDERKERREFKKRLNQERKMEREQSKKEAEFNAWKAKEKRYQEYKKENSSWF